MATRSGPVEVDVDGRRLSLSNLDKVLYPEAGFTKAAMVDYYRRVAPALLPHLRGRPLTLKRYPDGVSAAFFYAKSCPDYAPSWVKRVEVPSLRKSEKAVRYCLADDLPTLVWLVNLAAIELHPLLARATDDGQTEPGGRAGEQPVDHPTLVVFDLDPGPPAGMLECARVACLVRQVLDQLGLASYPKTSGSKGLQLYVPLNLPHSYDQTKDFSRALAHLLAQSHRDLVVDSQDKRLRRGKVLVDWGQNDRNKSTVAAYSLRAMPEPTVSTPVTWDEVEGALASERAEGLRFEAGDVVARVDRDGDLFAAVLDRRQSLPDLASASPGGGRG